MSVKDPAGAKAWFDAAIAKTGAHTTTQSFGGATLTLFDEIHGVQAAFAILDGKVAVAGDLASVESAVDTMGVRARSSSPGRRRRSPRRMPITSVSSTSPFGPILDLD